MSNKILDTSIYPTKAVPIGTDLVVGGDSANVVGGVDALTNFTFTSIARFAVANGSTVAGIAGNLSATPPAAGASSQAGVNFAISASNAVAGTSVPGAAKGGDVPITAGNAAQFSSGNANGGNIPVTPGAGVGTGSPGELLLEKPGGTPGTTEVGLSYAAAGGLLIRNSSNDGTGIVFQAKYGFNMVLRQESSKLQIAQGNGYAFNNSSDLTGGSVDAAVNRVAAKVIAPQDGNGNPGWLQNTSGEGALAAPYTNATAGLTNTNLSFNVIAGRLYRITGVLQISNTQAGEGAQFDFNGGGASATTFLVSTSLIGTATPGTVVSTSLAGAINWSSVTGTAYVILTGFLKVNLGGTLILRAAENTHSSGTLTIGAGSWIALQDTVGL